MFRCLTQRGRSVKIGSGDNCAIVSCIAVGVLTSVMTVAARADVPSSAVKLFESHCIDCHSGEKPDGGLDLANLGSDLNDRAIEARWVRIVDRVAAGEMPPRDDSQLPERERHDFVTQAGDWLRGQLRDRQQSVGRVQARRLTRREIERSIQDLLGIDVPLANQLPEESRGTGFSTMAEAQPMSHFQLERHLAVVDVALDEAFRRALTPPDKHVRDFDAEGVARENPKRRCREPEMLGGDAVVWSSGLIFYGRIPATTAPEDGWYRFRVRAKALKQPKTGGVWTSIHTGLCVSSAPLLEYVTSFEATEKPREIEFEAFLPKRHMLEIRPGDVTLKKARFEGGQVGAGEGGPQEVPGIAIERITMERFHKGPDDDGVRRILFGDLPTEPAGKSAWMKVKSTSARKDAERLLTTFARRAFRRPVEKSELQPYVNLMHATLTDGGNLQAAVRVGYRAVLCSPRFLYFSEQPGPLDDHAIATRLSYLLTGSTPDEPLQRLADDGMLRDPATIQREADRLLSGERGRRFLQDFSAEWLDLDLINFTEPDRRLYPEFDSIVQNSMLEETWTYLEHMLRDNLSVTRLIDSDFTYLNSRLARFYEIDGVSGDELTRVALGNKTHRGGVLTQGAILKVTANGNNTSPVVRGIWVSERLLGVEIPPPPGGVPAIEPDIRGAKTIREQLEKHRSQESCAVCHRQIDPPGFALENFDPAGRWRDRYLMVVSGKRTRGATIDASYTLPDGRDFKNVDSFQGLIAADPRPLARNVAEKLLVFGTGAPISFVDRQALEQIVDGAEDGDFGFRTLLLAVVTHPVFLSK